jgi:integrase
LAIRDALGLTAGTRGRLLHNFLDYTRGAAEPDMPIRAMTAVAWACDHAPPGCGDAGKAHRLMVARGFLTYLSAVVPGTEVPAYGLVAGHRRRRPYIFSDTEIEALTAAAATAPPRDGLRPTMLATLLGLLASTGLRIGEAIRLTMDDVRLDARPPHLRVLEWFVSRFLQGSTIQMPYKQPNVPMRQCAASEPAQDLPVCTIWP